MDAVTYPQEDVARFINQNVVALRVGSGEQPMASDFNITWTPSLLILDADGKEHQRTLGFFAPEDLIPSLLKGIGKMHLNRNELLEALDRFEELQLHHAGSAAVPETIYLAGVARYKNTGDARELKTAYELLRDRYGENPWTKRASPYRLL